MLGRPLIMSSHKFISNKVIKSHTQKQGLRMSLFLIKLSKAILKNKVPGRKQIYNWNTPGQCLIVTSILNGGRVPHGSELGCGCVPQLLFDDNECQLFQTGYIVI